MRPDRKYHILIGIDVGQNTGLAIFDRHAPKDANLKVSTVMIHQAMEIVLKWHIAYPGRVFVRAEDPRKMGGYKGSAVIAAVQQGVGSVKRDASIWDDYLTEKQIPFEMIAPNRSITKWDADKFRRLTGYTGTTDSHGRDASLLVYSM